MSNADQRSKTVSNRIILLSLAAILAITFFAHAPALKNEFTNWDDNWHIEQYFSKNNLDRINFETLSHVFTDFDSFDMYIPMIIFSWMVEYQVAGLNPFIYHLDNIIIHLFSTGLLFWLFYLLFKKLEIAVIIALMFGVSTINVESVAWISGRKDLLYTVFFLAALVGYVRYKKENQLKFLFFSIGFFLLALLSKAQSLFLAPTLILIDYIMGVPYLKSKKDAAAEKKSHPDSVSLFDRVHKGVLFEKVPYFLMAFVFGCLAVYAVKFNPAYTKMQFSLMGKTVFASYGFINYLLKSFIPYTLSAVYPYPVMDANAAIPAHYFIFLLPAILIFLVPFYTFNKSRTITFGLLFVITNIAAFLQFFSNSNLIMGDHYTYIASIGYYYLFAAGISAILYKKPQFKMGIIVLFCLYITVLSVLTFHRTQIWQNNITLWNDVLEKYPRSMEALIKRGRAKIDLKDYTGALKDFEKANLLYGNVHSIYQYIGICQEKLNQFAPAIENYKKDLRRNPNALDSIRGLGRTYYAIKAYDLSLSAFERVKAELPKSEEAYQYLGRAKMDMNNPKGAIKDLTTLIEINPRHTLAYLLRGSASFAMNDYVSALKDFDKTIQMNPNIVEAYYKRAITNGTMKNFPGVIKDIDVLLKHVPNEPFAYYLRGVAKIELSKDGCDDLKRAYKMGFTNALEKINASCGTQ